MASPESRQLRASFVRDGSAPSQPLEVMRAEWIAAASQAVLPEGVSVTPVALPEVPGEWISADGLPPQPVLLYFHGGGYNAGSCVTHRELAARLCLASGLRVLLADYRLAPEHPFPQALDDAVASYRWLLDQGVPPEQIVVVGDSSGAGLALATLLAVRDRGLGLPAAGALISPWVDLALTGESLGTHAAIDPLTTVAGLQQAAHWYLGPTDPTDPLASPLYGRLHDLPPLLIQVGSDEILLSDAIRLTARARAAGVEVSLEVWDEMWHVWHGWAAALPEARQAIERIGAFIRQTIAQPIASLPEQGR